MAVLQSHNWPGNVRQLKNNVERLMILTQADPEQEVTSEMLPSEIGALVPTTPNGAGGEKLMSLALREAREIFEREYLVAQIARFSETSRAPRNSSAWSARPCTGSSSPWGSAPERLAGA